MYNNKATEEIAFNKDSNGNVSVTEKRVIVQPTMQSGSIELENHLIRARSGDQNSVLFLINYYCNRADHQNALFFYKLLTNYDANTLNRYYYSFSKVQLTKVTLNYLIDLTIKGHQESLFQLDEIILNEQLNFLNHAEKRTLYLNLYANEIIYFNEQLADILCAEGDYEKAKTLYEQAIASGSLLNYQNIADIYYIHSEEKDYAKAFDCYNSCNTVHALYQLGKMYENGHGVEKSIADAYNCFYDCVANGYQEAKIDLVNILMDMDSGYYNPDLAFQYASETAEYNIASNFYLGLCYLNGTGTAVDNRKAFSCFLRASTSGVALHKQLLGDCYLEGIGVNKNAAKALEIYICLPLSDAIDEKILECYICLGDHKQIFTYLLKNVNRKPATNEQLLLLGKYYLEGEVVAQDKDIACKYLQLAADKGNEEALYLIALEYLQGGIESRKRQAISWFEQLAEKDLYEANEFLFNYYKNSNVNLAYKYALKLNDTEDNSILEFLAKNSLLINADDIDLIEAFKFNKKLADSGDTSVAKLIGDFYYQGLAIEKDSTEAFKYYSIAAGLGDADALFAIGNMYENGVDVAKNLSMAYKFYVDSAKNGSVDAQMALANFNENGLYVAVNYESAFEIYKKLSVDNSYAMFKLGEFLERGQGCSKNIKKALDHYNKALTKGEFHAAIKLAKMYETGSNVKKDYNKAFVYYKKISDHNTEAQLNIAKFYHYGLGVKKDFVEAIKYYEKASKNNIEAKKILGDIYYDDNSGYTDYDKAVRLYESALTLRGTNTFYALGNCYYYGKGVPQNYKKAHHLYTLAYNFGDVNGELGLGNCYYHGHGIEMNHGESFKYYTLAVSHNIIEAYAKLGASYENGNGVPKDINKAVEYYKTCINESSEAKYRLGELYLDGNLVTKNIVEGIKLLNEAAAESHVKAILKLALHYKNDSHSKSPAKAFNYYKQAALVGSIEGKKEYGLCHYFGFGTPKNQQLAVEIFLEECFTLDPEVRYYIGTYYKENTTSDNDVQDALYHLEYSAENYYHPAIFDLANLYFEGGYINKDLSKSFRYYSMLENEGARDVLFRLAYFYNNGISCKKDRARAISIYEKLKQENDVHSAIALGEIYYLQGKYEAAFKCYEEATSTNDKKLTYDIAICYLNGHGVKQDAKVAIKMIEKLAKAGYTLAINMIGELYLEGVYYKQNFAKAIKYFRQAEASGSEIALINLSKCYLNGQGVDVDSKEAFNILVKGSNKSNAEAINRLGEMYEAGNAIFQDLEKAFNYYSQAVTLGNDNAAKNLGKMYYNGVHATKDVEKACSYFVDAHENGVLEATAYLALCYYNGDGVEKSYFKAFELFNLSIDLPMSKNKIGECYEQGNGVEKNRDLAFKCYQEASDNSVDAQYNIAKMYEEGVSIVEGADPVVDLNLARMYYERAAAYGHEAANVALDKIKNAKSV